MMMLPILRRLLWSFALVGLLALEYATLSTRWLFLAIGPMTIFVFMEMLAADRRPPRRYGCPYCRNY
jgi:hypothetical protein